jgi:hypothetical protein
MENGKEPDYYAILGVAHDATQQEIKRAYRKKTQEAHPDHTVNAPQDERDRATADQALLNAAKETLLDPGKRAAYDYEHRKPVPVVTPDHIDFYDVKPGESQLAHFILSNAGGHFDDYGLQPPSTAFVVVIAGRSVEPDDQFPMQFDILATGEEWGKSYSTFIRAFLDDEEAQVHITLQTAQKPVNTAWDSTPKSAPQPSIQTVRVPITTRLTSIVLGAATGLFGGGALGAILGFLTGALGITVGRIFTGIGVAVIAAMLAIFAFSGSFAIFMAAAVGIMGGVLSARAINPFSSQLLTLSVIAAGGAVIGGLLAYARPGVISFPLFRGKKKATLRRKKGVFSRKIILVAGALVLLSVIAAGSKFIFSPALELHGDRQQMGFSRLGLIALENHGSLFAIKQDGESLPLTLIDEDNRDPCWGPDGISIAFARHGDLFYSLLHRPLAMPLYAEESEQCRFPAWSPDGKKIAFVSNLKAIRVLDFPTGPVVTILKGEHYLESPTWSPDGRKIAYVKAHGGNKEIYIMNADGTHQRRLTRNNVWDASPAWSPDGKRIAFARWRRSLGASECHNSDIWIMNSDGTNQHRISNDNAIKQSIDPEYRPRYTNEDDPCWSPNGYSIYFVEWSIGPVRVFKMNADGSYPSLVYQAAW